LESIEIDHEEKKIFADWFDAAERGWKCKNVGDIMAEKKSKKKL